MGSLKPQPVCSPGGTSLSISFSASSSMFPQLFVIDEIGKIELYSQQFIQTVQRILDGDVPILGTVAIRGDGLIQESKLRTDTQIIEVDNNNRDKLPSQIADRIRLMLH